MSDLQFTRDHGVHPSLQDPDSEFHLADYFAILRRRWQAIAVVTLLALALGVIHYFITPKEYRATTRLQIERRTASTLGNEFTAWLENYWSLEFYPTQYQLLKSRDLAGRVVHDLRLWENEIFNPTRAALPSVENPDANLAEDEAALGALANRLLSGIEVSPLRNTQLVDITYQSPSAELAARIGNSFADAFVDWGIETRTETASTASQFLAGEIEALKQQIQEKEDELQQYGQSSDIIGLDDPSANVTVRRLEQLNQNLSTAISMRIEKQARYERLKASGDETLADTLSGGLVSQERAKMFEKERQYQSNLQTYKPEWPAMVELEAEIDSMRGNLTKLVDETISKEREKARTEYLDAYRREQSLTGEFSRTKGEAMDQSSASVQYKNLQVEVSTRRALLDDLMKRQSGTEVTSRLQASRESNVRVIERALVPSSPFRPSLSRNLTLGLGFGVLFGVGLVLLLEYLDRTIKTGEQIEKILSVPALAVVPDIQETGRRYGYRYGYSYGYGRRTKNKDRDQQTMADEDDKKIELIPLTRPRLAVSEAYRSLRTALLLSSADELHAVAVTSANAGEGKTATSTNLAVVMAQLGRRVLMVDADLRKPRCHRVFDLSNRLGLVSYLTGSTGVEEIFLPTEVPNLYLTPSGPIPPNPSELLASEKMKHFLAEVRKDFDFVIIDTPPVLAVTDPTIVGTLVDGMVLCLRAGTILREDARTCRDRLLLSDVRVLGAVLNRYRVRQGGYGRRYYYSYEGYSESAEEPATGTAA